MIARRTQSTEAVSTWALKKLGSASSMRLPRPPLPTSEPTVVSATVDTVAMRSPAISAGSASGSSTSHSSRHGPYPMPRAASLASWGTASRPARMFRTRMVSE
ncbi:hypothetical protein YUWDRAFT_04947 [Streptomyces sp. AmelKG-D3]|nr:hypothetical protein YUWDRAFT_04947 [Streptomyces sp. AmelKG-D3]